MIRLALPLTFVVATVACSADNNSSSTMPHLIGGGGVADSPIAGTLHVHVVEDRSATPIANASVRVEGSPALVATTDATGLATFTSAALAGAQTITATAPGHAAATWFGANGANVTVPLEPAPRATPTAHASGTIAGWDALAAPAFGHYTLAVVLYSFVDDPTAPDNSIVQSAPGGTPQNTCLRTGGAMTTCAWQLATRTGAQVHVAVIVDGDAHGTADPSDDTYTLIGYAAGDVMTLAANQQITGESLAMVAGTTAVQVAFPAPVAGLPNAIAIPQLALGAAGRVVFPLPQTRAGAATAQVLAATGRFAGSYHAIALATPSPGTNTPFSSAFVTASATSVTVPPWLAAPALLPPAHPSYQFTAAPGAAFHTVRFSTSPTMSTWNVLVLDSATTFHLPALTPDPIGSGTITMAITAGDVPGFDPTHFDIPMVTSSLARASGAQTNFTH